MIPMQMCALKQDVGDDAEDGQRDTLLDDLQLNEVEGSAVFYKAQTVGRHLTAIFKEGNTPREGDNAYEWPVAAGARLL